MTAQAASRPRARTYDVVIRPRAALVRSTALSIVFSAVPLAVALVWVAFPLRLWALMGTLVLLLAVVVGVVFVRLGTAYVGIDAATVDISGVVSTRRRYVRDQVHRIVLAETFGSSVDRTVRELVAFTADGTHLFRMRADVWGDAGLDRVVETLGATVAQEPRPLSTREFAKRYPTSRAWYERPGGITFVGVMLVLLVAAVVAIGAAGLTGA